jgi:hypothetical protein
VVTKERFHPATEVPSSAPFAWPHWSGRSRCQA